MANKSIRGDAELRRKLAKLKRLDGVAAAVQGGAETVLGAWKVRPPVSRRPQPFVSDKQRRGFFAKLRSGEIEVPYRRNQSPQSEQMSKRWAIESRKSGLAAVIGNNASYARLVRDSDEQTKYHKETGWKTDAQVIKETEAKVLKEIQKAIDKILMG